MGAPVWGVGEMGSQADDIGEALVAEDEDRREADENVRRGPPGPLTFRSLEVEGQFFPEADVRGGGGSISETTIGAELGWTRVAAFNDVRRATVSYALRDYDVDQTAPYGSSLTRVNVVRVGGTVQKPFGDKWSWFATSRVSLQAGQGARLVDGWNVPFSAGVGYLINPRLNVSVGVLGILEAQLGATVIPIPAIRWMPTDRLTVMTLNGVVVTYKAGQRKEWELISSILYETFVFAVDDLEGFDEGKGVISQEYFQVRVGAKRNFGPMFQIGAFLEGRFNRRFEYYRDDDRFDDFRVDSGMGFRLTGTYRF